MCDHRIARAISFYQTRKMLSSLINKEWQFRIIRHNLAVWREIIILFCWVSIVYFNCIYDSLYHDMDIGTIRHCALVSCIPSQSIGLFLVCAVLVLSVIMCSLYKFLDGVQFSHDSCDYCWDFYIHCNYFDLCIWLSVFFLPSDSFIPYLYSILGYSTWEFQALQLIDLAVFGAVD